jgi:hypothetical protein
MTSKRASRRSTLSGNQPNVPNVSENTAASTGADEEPAVEIQSDETSEIRIGEGQPKGEAYPPASREVTVEEHQTQMDEESEKREARASKVKGPRKLNNNEKKIVAYWLEKHLKDDEPTTKTVLLDEMDKDLKPFFQPSMQGNVVQRGIFSPVYDDDKRLIGAFLTDIGADIYFSLQRKGKLDNGTGVLKATPGPKTPKGESQRPGKYTEQYRLKKMVEGNPRRNKTQGYFSWELYEDGMPYREYLKSVYNKELIAENGTPFGGPGRNHWDYDLMKGFTALYDVEQDILDPDGRPNPKYWFVNNSGQHFPPDYKAPETTEEIDEAAE